MTVSRIERVVMAVRRAVRRKRDHRLEIVLTIYIADLNTGSGLRL
jgi:hypothetical protein